MRNEIKRVEVNVQPILDPILYKLREMNLGEVKMWKGKNKKEGHVLVTIMSYEENRRIDIDINVEEALKDPQKYFNNFFNNVVDALQAGRQFRQEDTRIGYLNG